MRRSRLSWGWTTAIIAFLLLLFGILLTYLEGHQGELRTWEFWRAALLDPLLISYFLAMYPLVRRMYNRALQAHRPLLQVDEVAFSRLVTEGSIPRRRWEWAAMALGVAFIISIVQPWILDSVSRELLWLYTYVLFLDMLVFGLFGWLVYDLLTRILRLSRLSRQHTKLDIFDFELLTPIGQWGLGISAILIGGISLSLVFQTQESLLRWQPITIYAVLICVTVLIFFLSTRSVHKIMAHAKRNKLTLARKHLALTSRKLEKMQEEGRFEGLEGIYSAIAASATYERRIRESPEWPFNTGIIRRLLTSIVVPIAVYLVKILGSLGIRIGM